MNRPVIAETRPINGITVETITPAERAQINTNTNNIAANTSAISTANNNIASNLGLIQANQTSIAVNASNISTNTSNISSNTTAIATKQDTITRDTDFIMDQLNVGGTQIAPGSSVITRLFIDTPYTTSANLANGFGNSIQFRFNRGIGGTQPVRQGQISCYFKSGANTSAPYVGMLFEGIDDNTIQPLLNVYHEAPNDDGRSVLEVGGGEGRILARTIGLTGDIIARRLLTNSTSTFVGGHGFWRFEGNSGQINMNTTAGVDIPWTPHYVDGNQFSASGNGIQVLSTGYYEVNFNVYLTSIVDRPNPTIRIRINGADTGYLAWSYIRSFDNTDENNWCLSPVLLSLQDNDVITIQGKYTANGRVGAVYLYKNASTTNTAYSSLYIKRIA